MEKNVYILFLGDIMRRPFTSILMFYIIGIILGKMEFITLLIILCFIQIGLIFLFYKRKIFLILLTFFLLLGYGTSFIQMNKNSQLQFLNNKTAKIQAYVLEPTIQKENKTEFYLEVQKIEVNGKTYLLKEKTLVSLYDEKGKHSRLQLIPGQIITFEGKIKIPKGIRNPGGFDYALYLRTKKIYATITIFSGTIQIQGKQSLGIRKEFIYQIKNKVENIINVNLSKNHAQLLKGILFGDKSLSKEMRDSFVDVGVAHVLAVSGLHVGFILSLILVISGILKWSTSIKLIFLTFILIFYIVITGASPSVIRASIMAWVSIFSKFINKNYDGLSALSLAGLIILLPNPLLIYTASFQLSFLASMGIILFYRIFLDYLKNFSKISKFISSALAITMAAQIGTLPVNLYHFHQISIISIISNIIIVPFIGILLKGSIIAITVYFFIPFVGSYFFFLISFVFELVIKMVKIFSSFPYASIFLPSFTWWGLILYIFILLIIGRYIPVQIKKIKILTFLGISLLSIFVIIFILIPPPLKVTFLDVGQGDSILLETPNGKNILIDGGGYANYQGEDRKISEDVLLPAFYSKGIHKLDLVIVSHPHEDHMKGIQELIGNIPIDILGVYPIDQKYMKELNFLATNEKIKMIYLKEGDILNIQENLIIRALSPSKDFSVEDPQKDVNNSSLVLRLDYYKSSFLFTGDIEEEIENDLLQKGENLQADVLKVAHHGSNSSSKENFIKNVDPEIGIISVGEGNTFGHPSPNTLEQLKKVIPYLYRTDKNGAIEISTNGNWIKVDSYLSP